ncbi:hypothetical protein X736_07490 [Mesorhizobium sp. L2C089B000]|nr:hypothetical protein X736_07490 [Mesorhizobium sp. L2C089B000]
MERQRDRLKLRRPGIAHANAVIGEADDPVAGGRLLLLRRKPRPARLLEPPEIQTLRAKSRHDPPALADSKPRSSRLRLQGLV